MQLFLLFFLLVSSVSAQDFSAFLTPEPAGTSIELDNFYSPSVDVDKKNDHTKVHLSSLGINQSVYTDSKNVITLGGKWQKLDLESNNDLLDDYYNIQGQVGWRRELGEDKFSYLNLSYGSATNKPFQAGRDGTLSANYIQKFNSKWFGAINYSNNRTFLNNIPLPGFFYVKEMTREKALIIGFPFIYWMRSFSDRFRVRYFGLLPWSHRLRVLYQYRPFLLPYIGFDQNPMSFFRHDREKKTDRFFWFERRLSLGVEGVITKSLKLDFSSGLAFDRKFFEAKNFSESENFQFDLEKSLFVSLSFRYRF